MLSLFIDAPGWMLTRENMLRDTFYYYYHYYHYYYMTLQHDNSSRIHIVRYHSSVQPLVALIDRPIVY